MFRSGTEEARGLLRAFGVASIIQGGMLAAALAGCSGDAAQAGNLLESCTAFEPVELGQVTANVRVLTTSWSNGLQFSPLAPSLLADETGVYWYDGSGRVSAQPHGQSGMVELLPAAERGGAPQVRLPSGLALGSENLYVGEAFMSTNIMDNFDLVFSPPGRLLSVPKGGGPATVLLEREDSAIVPIVVVGEQLIVSIGGEGFVALREGSSQLEPLPTPPAFMGGQRSGDTLYRSDDDFPPQLLSARLGDASAVHVMQLEDNNYYAVGPDYVLTRDERLLTEPDYAREQRLILNQPETGCSRPLPGLGEAISYDNALDASAIYWVSVPTEETPVRPSGTGSDVKLIQLNLATGALTHLALPGVELAPGFSIVGQDADTLYVGNGNRLLAVEKP